MPAPIKFADWKRDHLFEKQALEKIEADHLYPDDGRVPHVPFGFNHAKWLKFKGQMQPGDELYLFSTSAESWRHLAGRMGCVLVRGDNVIDVFITRMN